MSSVGSGSLLCRVIDLTLISYLEHCQGRSQKLNKFPWDRISFSQSPSNSGDSLVKMTGLLVII